MDSCFFSFLLLQNFTPKHKTQVTAKSGKVFSFYLDKTDLCFVVCPQCAYIEVLVREYIFEFMEVTSMIKDGGKLDTSPARTRNGDTGVPPPPPPPPPLSTAAAAAGVEIDGMSMGGGEGEGEAIPEGWERVDDEASGKQYYYHTTSGATQWTIPEVADALSKGKDPADAWVEIEDPESGKIYFFNEETGETSWHPKSGGGNDEEEEEEEEAARPSGGASRRSSMAFVYDDSSESKSVGVMETLDEEEEDEEEEEEEEDEIDLGGNEWALMTDETTGKEYYVNINTGESQWDMPEDAWTQHDHEGRGYWVNSITGESSIV